MIIEGKTKSGFKFALDERVLDDWRFVDAIGLSESDDASESIRGMRDMVKMVVGDRYDAFKKHIADKNDGFVPREKVTEEIIEIVNLSKDLKNSQSSEG